MDMLERAARAALDEFGIHLEELAPGAEDDIAQRVVRAVLLAIREPNQAMLDAGMDYDERELNIRLGRPPTCDECQAGEWQAMIDAILRDQ